MQVQAFVSERAIEALDIGIIRGLAGTAEVDPDAAVISPEVDKPTGKFRAIVSKKISWRPALTHQAVEDFDDMLTAKALPNLDRQPFAAEHIDHRQHSELLPIAELVVDEVQAPCFIRALRLAPCLTMHEHPAPTRLLGTQR